MSLFHSKDNLNDSSRPTEQQSEASPQKDLADDVKFSLGVEEETGADDLDSSASAHVDMDIRQRRVERFNSLPVSPHQSNSSLTSTDVLTEKSKSKLRTEGDQEL